MEHSFRTSVFGFNKEDVAKFVYQQSKSFEKKLAEKEAALDEAEKVRSEAEDRADAWEGNCESVKRLKELMKSFRDQYELLSCALSDEEADMNAIEEGYQGLQDRCNRLEAFREKADKFDSLAAALSGIFGSGIDHKPSDEPITESTETQSSPIHRARVNQENKRKAVLDMEKICQEVYEVIEEMRV